MIRSKSVLPDAVETLADGSEMEVVSAQGLMEALAGFVQLTDVAGGWVTFGVRREKTGVPNEMRTVSAIIEWRDRTDAKPAPETPSVPAQIPGQEELLPVDPTPEQMEKALEDDNPDGFVPMAEVDVDSIPASMR